MEELLRRSPKITLILILASVGIEALSSFKIVSSSNYHLSYKLIKKFELWRLFTSFLYFGNFGFSTFIHTIMLFNASKDLENCGGAQYLYFICIVYIGSLAAAGVFTIPFISDVFFLAVCYVNCRKNRDSKIALMGLPFSVSAAYIPYIFLAFGFSYANIVGICFGHVYYFFEEVYPKLPNSRNRRILACPEFFYRISDVLRL